MHARWRWDESKGWPIRFHSHVHSHADEGRHPHRGSSAAGNLFSRLHPDFYEYCTCTLVAASPASRRDEPPQVASKRGSSRQDPAPERSWFYRDRRGSVRHVGSARPTEDADEQPVEDHRHCESGRYARLLRLLSDRLRAGVHYRRMAPDVRPICNHPAVVWPWRRPRRLLLGLDGGSHRAPESLHCHRAQCLAGHRRHGIHPRSGRLDSRLDLSCVLPLLRRLRQRRPDRRGHSARAGIRPVLQARLGERNDHRPAAGGQPDGCVVRCISGAVHRLAGTLSRRSAPGGAGPDDPLLGAGIATLAAAHGSSRGGAQVRWPGRSRSIQA